MTKEKILSRLKKTLFLITILSFLIIYIAADAGYFDYIKNRRVVLTKEQIALFEQDVKDGKELDIDAYYVNNKTYNNKASNLGLSLSNKIRTITKNILNELANALNDFLNTE